MILFKFSNGILQMQFEGVIIYNIILGNIVKEKLLNSYDLQDSIYCELNARVQKFVVFQRVVIAPIEQIELKLRELFLVEMKIECPALQT